MSGLGTQFLEHVGGGVGDRTVRVGAQAGEVARADLLGRHGTGAQRFQQGLGGLGPADDLLEYGRRLGRLERLDQHGVGILAGRGAEGGGERAAEGRRRARFLEQLGDSGERRWAGLLQAKEAGGEFGAARVGLRPVDEVALHLAHDRLGGGGELAGAIPFRDELQGGGYGGGIAEQALEQATGGGVDNRRRVLLLGESAKQGDLHRRARGWRVGRGLHERGGAIHGDGGRECGDEGREGGGVGGVERERQVLHGVVGRRGDQRRTCPVIGGARVLGEDGLALRGRGGGEGGGVALLGEAADRRAGDGGEGLRAGGAVVLQREAPGELLHVGVGAGLDRAHEARQVTAVERRRREFPRLLVLHAPDAGEVMIAIRAHRGVGGAVDRAAGVVVDHRLVVEIDHVERAVGSDARLDRAEPQVAAAHELRLLAARLAAHVVAHAVAPHELVVDDVEGRFAGEVAVVPTLRPGAALVDRATGGGGEAPHLVDLRVGLLRPRHERVRGLVHDHALPGGRALDLALRQHALGQQGVEKHRATGGLRPKDLPVPRGLEAPGVAVAAAVLLKRGAVGFEADDTAAAGGERALAVA